jgi:hypothetical protein
MFTVKELLLLEGLASGELVTMDYLKVRVPQLDLEPKKLEILNLRMKIHQTADQVQALESSPPPAPAKKKRKRRK